MEERIRTPTSIMQSEALNQTEAFAMNIVTSRTDEELEQYMQSTFEFYDKNGEIVNGEELKGVQGYTVHCSSLVGYFTVSLYFERRLKNLLREKKGRSGFVVKMGLSLLRHGVLMNSYTGPGNYGVWFDEADVPEGGIWICRKEKEKTNHVPLTARELKTMRRESGLSQEQIARMSGLSLSAYQSYEQGRRKIPYMKGFELRDIFKMFMNGEGRRRRFKGQNLK